MKHVLKLFLLLFILLSVFENVSAQATYDDRMVRVGLFYGDSALPTANLENSVGQGYRFGYYTEDGTFCCLGTTDETQISMLKTQNIYLKDNLYSTTHSGNSTAVIGCYHVQLPDSYESFSEAKEASASIADAFPAWISGQYVVRIGAYESKDSALNAQSNLGQAETTIVGTSSYGITITKTKTATILFQYDSMGTQTLVVNPGQDDTDKTVTWFKGYRYYGDFFYERIDGGNITVSNYLSMDDYVKGILPYEMNASWPLEALKAQAICARTYTLAGTGNRHQNQHFDICNTVCCQVYRGLNRASENSDRAVEETSGIYAWYNGNLAQTYYYASNGGASEDVRNVWGSNSNLPYLCGVLDPYESAIESTISGYHWTVNFTPAQLTERLQSRGYSCSTIVDLKVTQYTELGNVFSIVFVDTSGSSFPFTRERARSILGLKSLRFQIGGSDTDAVYYVDESGKTLSDMSDVWTIDGRGETGQLSESSSLYAITASGTEALSTSNSTPTGEFVITGTGNGHHIGMSQWGAYAMAKQGMTYDQILKFYFAGIDLY